MRIWLIGAGKGGIEILHQLAKNSEIDLFVSSVSEKPPAVREGVISKVQLVERVTSYNVNTLAKRIRPDLILIDSGEEDKNLGRVMGGSAMSAAMNDEIASASDFPCLVL
ncbi:MAG: hypothetical protein HC802_08730 [Caldilineaceae bacterium]|nr:hypothetical protein [Caldilineaceae bacterium]